MPHKEGKWYVIGNEGIEVTSTRGKSKDESTDKFCEQMDMLDGIHHDWIFWSKRGYKLRKD